MNKNGGGTGAKTWTLNIRRITEEIMKESKGTG
jgi:hypothetical protein